MTRVNEFKMSFYLSYRVSGLLLSLPTQSHDAPFRFRFEATSFAKECRGTMKSQISSMSIKGRLTGATAAVVAGVVEDGPFRLLLWWCGCFRFRRLSPLLVM